LLILVELLNFLFDEKCIYLFSYLRQKQTIILFILLLYM
jgi:hypothetical protein